jgi:hypothetical protein
MRGQDARSSSNSGASLAARGARAFRVLRDWSLRLPRARVAVCLRCRASYPETLPRGRAIDAESA